ncbi:hypothetical protein AAIA72_06780 [Hahella sp. SMD15-11]|uniref:DUF669 domain-containing protein n=1 Tax=Thermohahella caldifontis TaxID=3142973 RepID=A0AB39V0S5_9GAMM
MSYFDFNNAEDQTGFDLIPKGTLVKVRMTIRPGGFDDPTQGWTGGYATQSQTTGSVYLNCEFVVLEGPYARRKMWSLIGLHSPKGPEWANMGRAFIKGILNSARGVHPGDNSSGAQQARRIQGFQDLDGIEFVARVDVEKDQNGEDRNVVKQAITPDHKDYAAVMGQPSAPAAPQQTQAAPGTKPNRPSWAQ